MSAPICFSHLMFTNRQVKENDFKEKDLAFRYLKSFSNFKGIESRDFLLESFFHNSSSTSAPIIRRRHFKLFHKFAKLLVARVSHHLYQWRPMVISFSRFTSVAVTRRQKYGTGVKNTDSQQIVHTLFYPYSKKSV